MGRPKLERIKVHCAYCGVGLERSQKQIDKNTSGRFFCDADHANKGGRKPRKRHNRECKQCGTVFYPSDGDQWLCTKACHDEWQRKERVIRTCEYCGCEFKVQASFGTRQVARYHNKECESLARIKRPLDRLHNGRPAKMDKSGYVQVWEPEHPSADRGGWVSEHRLIAEQVVDRSLERGEDVHHINGKKGDNRPENLAVMTSLEHAALEGAEKRKRWREWEEYRKLYGNLENSLDGDPT